MECAIFEYIIRGNPSIKLRLTAEAMKRLFFAALCTLPVFGYGQTLLYNDGAMIKVQTGATLYVEGGIHNANNGSNTGVIDNDGTIEVRGNFINAGTWEASHPNTLKFSGNINSDVTPGSAQFHNVVIQKDATFNVNLLGNMTVNNNLDFNATGASRVNLGAFDLNMGATATATGHDSDEFVITGGAGKMKKTYNANGSFVFPVGFDGSTYNPATINKTAGPNETFSVRCLAAPTDGNGLTGTALTTDVVNAVWDIQETTGGGNTFDVTLGWAESDELTGFDDNLNAVSHNDGTNGWGGLYSDLGPEVGNTRTKTGFTAGGAFAVGDKPLANEIIITGKVFLQGPYSAGLMGDQLRTGNYLPTTEPYSIAPFNYVHTGYGGGEAVANYAVFDQSGTNDDIVDWIILEIRDGSTPATKLATRTALIQRDGDIVDINGTSSVKFSGLGDGTYHFALKHRNHLPVRTNSAVAMSAAPAVINFTTGGFNEPGGIAFDNGSTVNEPMANLGGGVWGMFGGDVNQSNTVSYGTGDRLAILQKVGTSTPSALVNGYWIEDATMNGQVAYGTGDRLFVLNVVGTSTPSRIVSAHQ